MWLNQQTIDAIRLMIELGRRSPEMMRASELARSSSITIMNVQKTVYALSSTGLIETQRGRNGGVRLIRPASSISLAEIVRAFEPKDCPAGFLGLQHAQRKVSDALFRAHRGFFQPLEAISLGELLNDDATTDALTSNLTD